MNIRAAPHQWTVMTYISVVARSYVAEWDTCHTIQQGDATILVLWKTQRSCILLFGGRYQYGGSSNEILLLC